MNQAFSARRQASIKRRTPCRSHNSLAARMLAMLTGWPPAMLTVPARLMEQHRKTQRIFAIVMSAVAGISLLVGGIGIMNIMLASVLERKSEIGLLRAVGAREVDIVRQFLVEATVIALIGAGIGVLLGIVLAYTIATFAGWASCRPSNSSRIPTPRSRRTPRRFSGSSSSCSHAA